MTEAELDQEIDRNYDSFTRLLPSILSNHHGQYALLRHQDIADFFPDFGTAIRAGDERFADRMYSVQEVTDRPADLGFFSHALDTRIA